MHKPNTFVAIHGKNPMQSLADATVRLWKTGQLNVQFWALHRCQQTIYSPVALPSYQFEGHRHWLEYTGFSAARGEKKGEQEATRPVVCPHCSKNISDFPYIAQDMSQSQGVDKSVFKVDVRSRRYQDLVKGHEVVGSPICPAAMYLELASHAVALLLDAETTKKIPEIEVEDLEIKAPLGLDAQRSIILTLTKKNDGVWAFELRSSKGSGKPALHATGTISLRRNSSMNNGQGESDKWDRMSRLLEEDTDTEALRGAMVYKVFRKMARYSSAHRGLRYSVGKGPEGAGDIAMPAQEQDSMARTPNDSIGDPVVMDNFLQVPGAFVHSLRAVDEQEEEDGSTAYICTGIGSVGPMNELRGNNRYRAYTKVVREDKKEAVLDVFAFDKQSRKMVWSTRKLKFSRVPRNSLTKVLAGANPTMDFEKQPASPPEPASQLPAHKSLVQRTQAAPLEKSSRGDETSANVLGGVQEVLSKSLGVPVEEITEQASLEELGIDSLVTSEALANIFDKFDVNISTEDFATVAEVATLCNMISSRLSGIAPDTSSGDSEDSGPDSVFEAADNANSVWQKTVFEILSHSLDLPVTDIQLDAKLEDLGADSLVSGEIISNLNDAFGIDISVNEFADMIDVASLCSLISNTLSPDSVPNYTESSSATSHELSISKTAIPMTPYTDTSTPTESGKSTPPSTDAGSIHTAFQHTRRNFDDHAKDTNLTGYWDQVYPPQLRAVTAFITEAFEKLGCPIGKFRHGEKLPTLQGTLAKYRKEVPRLWEILEEACIVERKGDDFLRGSAPLSSDISSKSAEELVTKLISDFPQYASAHGLFALLGPHLADCLIGKADPVTLLFGSDKGRNLLEDFYANGPDLRAATQVLCDFLSAAIHSQSSNGEPFRVLEIGAGTGGTTKHLVPLLQATGLPFIYTFTELSVSLLARAKKTFRGVEGMEFLKLNVEQDPPEELLGRYHVVVSSNCVHATRDLVCSLTNIRKLVRPHDGCVALVELTQKLAWFDLVWGLLDGWWLFNDNRKYALQSPWAWERAMRDAGFPHVDWSEGASRESRAVRVICGMAAEPKGPCLSKATSMLLHRGVSALGDRNLFLAPDGFGSGAVFGALQPLLRGVKDISVYALNSPFIKNKPDPEEPPTIEELAAIYGAEIKRRQP
ncbi:polyketide synthase dehydratase-domain-containing protein [Hypoxylon sp. NC1633]|nr:polyketide synthase dehydratase-domain-containing protein [Hypoxylon sp. NC1633]